MIIGPAFGRGPGSALSACAESLGIEYGNRHALAYKSIALLSLELRDEYTGLIDYDKYLYADDVVPPVGHHDLGEF